MPCNCCNVNRFVRGACWKLSPNCKYIAVMTGDVFPSTAASMHASGYEGRVTQPQVAQGVIHHDPDACSLLQWVEYSVETFMEETVRKDSTHAFIFVNKLRNR